MELDDLKNRWEEQDAKLNASLKLNAQLLFASGLAKTESALGRLSRLLVAGLVLNFVAAVWLGSFNWVHAGELRFLVPGVVLHLGAIALLLAGIRQLVALKRIDLAEPVVTTQGKLESLRVERLRAVKWTLLLSPLAWVALLIVVLKGLFDVNAYSILDGRWLGANVLFGVLVLVSAILVSRRYADRMGQSILARRFMRDLTGQNLAAAISSLDGLVRFADDEAHS
ncbi:MAG: hypothetical protein ACHQC8_05870 [Solirubrobacterales bacterium]